MNRQHLGRHSLMSKALLNDVVNVVPRASCARVLLTTLGLFQWYWVLGAGCQVLGAGCPGAECQVLDVGCWVPGGRVLDAGCWQGPRQKPEAASSVTRSPTHCISQINASMVLPTQHGPPSLACSSLPSMVLPVPAMLQGRQPPRLVRHEKAQTQGLQAASLGRSRVGAQDSHLPPAPRAAARTTSVRETETCRWKAGISGPLGGEWHY